MAVCLLPEIIRMVNPSIPFQFGGTSLLIIVVGVMDFVAQTQSHLMSHQYEGLMKKASLARHRELRNESSSFGEEDLQKLQESCGVAASSTSFVRPIHGISSVRDSGVMSESDALQMARTAPRRAATDLIFESFLSILARFFACAIVVRKGEK